MSPGSCKLPGNPDIAGVGVRIAIYIQNLLCFIPAFWALADGKVTRGELEAAETQATTNLVLAFAILISSIVQAQTLGLTNYHASIVLNMSWMNNTNAFIYFLLYVQYKSQGNNPRRVPPTWSAWARHIRGLAVSVIPGTSRGRPGHDSTDPEAGKSDDGVAPSAQILDGDSDSRRGAKILVKRFVLLLGSLHLTLMAGLGLWLWSNIRAFGEGQDTSNECAAKQALVAILGSHVPFASVALRIASLFVYAIFLAPGINLLLPIALFLGLYSFWRVLPIPKVLAPGEVSVGSPFHYAWLRLSILRVCNSIARRWSMLPPFIGLIFLLAVNLVFIIDIELALKQNDGLQDREEAVWGFGQILAMLLLFMPLRDLIETILARRTKQRQKDLDMALGSAINAGDRSMVLTWLARGANLNAKLDGDMTAIQLACSINAVDIIKALLDAGADPNIQNGPSRGAYAVGEDNKICLRLLKHVEDRTLDAADALLLGAEKGYGAGVRLFLALLPISSGDKELLYQALSGLNVNAADPEGRTALIWAVVEGQEAVVEFLLGIPGINVNTSQNGWTPLTCATIQGHEAIAKLLLMVPRGINVNVPNANGITALSWAAKHGREGIARLLLAMPGIDVNAADRDGWTALMLAVANKHEALVDLLLGAPGIEVNAADLVLVNAPDTSGETILGWAARKGQRAFAHLLLTAPGIDANAADIDGKTALICASMEGHEDIVKLLLAAPGIDVNAPDTGGRTPLSFAAENGRKAVVKRLLAAPGIDVNAPDTGGWTPLSFAAENGRKAVVKLLLAAPGIDVNAPDTGGRTPLTFAEENGREAVVRLLLAAPGIDVNAPDTGGRTPLIFAAENGREALLRLLLAVPGIDVNAPDTGGRTPLSFAAERGHEVVVELLLTIPGIDANAADTNGWTALIWAAFEGKEAIVQDLCTVPDIIVDVADVKRQIQNLPGHSKWEYGASKYVQGRCVRILEEFVESKGAGVGAVVGDLELVVIPKLEL